MNPNAWHRLSLRRTLLLVLLPGMLLVTGVELWLSWRTALDAANAAYDRSLLGAIKAMDANISTASGGLSVELPYRLLEFFELTASGQVFYRVATGDDLVEIGNADLPKPPRPLVNGRPQFSDEVYFGVPIRLGSYARELAQPLAGQPGASRVIIQVGETLESRQDFTRRLVIESLARDLLLIFVGMGLLVAAISWSLRPLQRLRNEVQARAPQDLAPIEMTGIPLDVKPLVDAINHHVTRYREAIEARRRFVDDASHQLRTPLTTLATQVGFALREPDAQRMRTALQAIKAQLDETVRQTNQMLSLARADTVELATEPCDLVALAEAVTRHWWPAARERAIDLGFERAGADPLVVQGHAGLLKEALGNLLHNALRYAPQGARVTVRVERAGEQGVIRVIDNGPGIAASDQLRAGERFFRGSNVTAAGSGLGLAIVRSIAQRHGGELQLADGQAGPHGQGVTASMVLPLSA
ncbi:MAG: sensor histidine kinase [Polaromonas sp.]